MRIAMLQALLPPSAAGGGVGHQVDLLARTLVGRGHHVTVHCLDGGPVGAPYSVTRLPAGEGRLRRVVGVGRAFAQVDFGAFDVVHAHGDDWLLGRRPRVRTFYGSAIMEARFATTWARRGAQVAYYGLEWVSSVNRNAVAISNGTRRFLPLVRGSVPCAVDSGAFFPGGAPTAHPSVLFVAGTLKGRKRGDLLLASFRELQSMVPGVQLTVVSQDRVAQPGVTCLSGLPAEELGQLYRSHWLLCSTSSYEGFGVPYAEALASGLPVVTTTNRGAREVLEGGRLGVLTRPERLTADIAALLGDDDRRAALSAAGVAAAERYRSAAVAAAYEDLYAAACAPRRASRTRGRT